MPLVAQSKNVLGFNQAIENFSCDLKKYCRSLTRSYWEGEDLMQETLIKAYKSWLQSPKPINKAFLFRIASNTWIDGHRKRRPDIVFDSSIVEVCEQEHGSTVDHAALYEAMTISLKALSAKQRVVFLLIEGFGYQANEVATMIGLTEGAVKAALHRARKKLLSRSEEEFYEIEDDEVAPYVAAITSGHSEKVIELYHQEMNSPKMQLNNSIYNSGISGDQGTSLSVQWVRGAQSSYAIVEFYTADGVRWAVPFYQSEWATLSTFIESNDQAKQLVA